MGDENTFKLGPYNGDSMGDDMELASFHQLDNGLWQALSQYYSVYGGVSTHHAFNSKYCSICLRNNYRLHLTGNNQTKGPTVPGQNGKSTCSTKDRNGKYQFHGRFQDANDELRDVADWVKSYSTYCQYSQGLYVNKEFLANMGLTDLKDWEQPSGELIPLVKGQKYCPESGSVCNERTETFREYHLNFDLQFSEANQGNYWRSIVHLGESHNERLPGIWVIPNTKSRFHIMFSNTNGVYYQHGFSSASIDLPAMLDMQPHNFDIKVYAADPNCSAWNCAAKVEFKFDGVSQGIENMGSRLNGKAEPTYFYISSPLYNWNPYPGASIGNIIYEPYSG